MLKCLHPDCQTSLSCLHPNPNPQPSSIERILKSFDEKTKCYDIASSVRPLLKEFLTQSLETVRQETIDFEQTKLHAKDEIEKLIEKHKQKACQIANVLDYDPVNMYKFVENPIVRTLVYQHIDTVRELTDLITLLNAK